MENWRICYRWVEVCVDCLEFVDFGSCSGFGVELVLWWYGLFWFEDWDVRLKNLVIVVSVDFDVEFKVVKEVLVVILIDVKIDRFD